MEKTRKILYTEKPGSGWVSSLNESAPPEQRRLMASFGPLVEAVEAFNQKVEGLPRMEWDDALEWVPLRLECVRSGPVDSPRYDVTRMWPRGESSRYNPYAKESSPGAISVEGLPLVWVFQAQFPRHLPVEEFLREWVRLFGAQTPPYLGALPNLAVEEIDAAAQVRVVDLEGGREGLHLVWPDPELF